MKSMFSKEFLDRIHEQLLAKKEDVENELKAFAEQSPKNKADYDTTFPDLGDKTDENAAEVVEYSTNLSLENTLEKVLEDVNEALERFDQGNYGVCKYCKKPIDERRLIARPTSSACIDCKKKLTLEA
jgi:RNA polymerase-binding protein DksA